MKRRAFRSRTAGIRKGALAGTSITRIAAPVHGGHLRPVALLGRRLLQASGAQRGGVALPTRLAGAPRPEMRHHAARLPPFASVGHLGDTSGLASFLQTLGELKSEIDVSLVLIGHPAKVPWSPDSPALGLALLAIVLLHRRTP
jgi:hypothetical protein